VKNLFAAILAISASTSVIPAIANDYSNSSNLISDSHLIAKNVLPSEVQSSNNFRGSISHQFAQRSLNIAKQIPVDALGLLIADMDANSWQLIDGNAIDPLVAIDKLFSLWGQFPELSILKDVRPWLGKEVAIAFLANTENKKEVSFAALSPIADDPKFAIFLKKLKSLDLPKETLYQNVTIWEWQLQEEKIGEKVGAEKPAIVNVNNPVGEEPEEDTEDPQMIPKIPDFRLQRIAIAKLPSGVAVVASDRQAIQQIIDTAAKIGNDENTTRTSSLADSQLFGRSLNNPLWDKSLLAGYGEFKQLGQIYELLAADLPETSEIPGFNRAEYLQGLQYTLAQYSSFDLFMWVTPKGIRSQSNSYFSEVRSPLPKDTATRDRLLSYLPSTIYGAITSRDLNRQWQWFVEESKVQPSYKIFVEGLRMLSPYIIGSGLDLDIEKDIISWIDGEYALTVFPSDKSPFQEIGIDLTMGMLIRTSKPEAASATLAKVTKYFGAWGENTLQIKKRQIGTTLLTSFEFPDGQTGKTHSIFAYGWRDRQTLILTLGANTASAFIPTPKPALAESEMFREAIADMPQPNFGYFYLDVKAIAKPFANFIINMDFDIDRPDNEKPKLPEPIAKVIEQLGGAVFVYSETRDRFQADFFLGLN